MKINILQNNTFEEFKVPEALIKQCTGMSLKLLDYFKEENNSKKINMNYIILSRAREKGMINAAQLMRDASEGKFAKRAPLNLRRIDNKQYLVLDGNSTAIILKAIGVSHVLGIVEEM